MIKSSKTNMYGDKEIHGYICPSCYRKRVERRSFILLSGTFISGAIGLFFFGLVIYIYLFVKVLLEEDFFVSIETFTQLGIFFIFFALIMAYIRRRELTKMRKNLRSLRY